MGDVYFGVQAKSKPLRVEMDIEVLPPAWQLTSAFETCKVLTRKCPMGCETRLQRSLGSFASF